MPFQTTVNTQPAPAMAGDFASANPRAVVLAGPGALVCGPAGVTCGRFAWIDPANQSLVSNQAYGSGFGLNGVPGAPAGFVHREQQALITTYLAETSNLIPQGFGITLMSAGDFWVNNAGSSECTPGMYAYANFFDGQVTFNAANNAPASGTFTGSVAASTSSSTGSIAGNVLTVTAVSSGTLYAGTTISGTNVASGSMITAQISGTAGGVGTYYVNIGDQTVASTTISGTYGTLTVTAPPTVPLTVGQLISGGSVAANSYITALITGTGGNGTYVIDTNTAQASTTLTSTTSVLVPWRAVTSGPAGTLVKISSWNNY